MLEFIIKLLTESLIFIGILYVTFHIHERIHWIIGKIYHLEPYIHYNPDIIRWPCAVYTRKEPDTKLKDWIYSYLPYPILTPVIIYLIILTFIQGYIILWFMLGCLLIVHTLGYKKENI
jgi:hypothetical protein